MSTSFRFQNDEAAVTHPVDSGALRLSHWGVVTLGWLRRSWIKHADRSQGKQ